MSKQSKTAGLVIVLVIILLLGISVWPTCYRYDQIKMKDNILPVRINRLTGRSERLTLSGWDQMRSTYTYSKELPSSELAKLTGQASITNYGWLECDIYNGSKWTVSEIVVKATVKNPDGTKVLSRKYRLSPQYGIKCASLKSTIFSANLGFKLQQEQSWEWGIISAKGQKE